MSLTTFRSLQSMSSQSRLGTNALHRTGRLTAGIALGLSVCLLVCSKAEANTFEFQKVVDTNTSIPNGTENFAGFVFPALDKNNVAFRGLGSSPEPEPGIQFKGIYIKAGNTLKVVADTNTPIPNSIGNFADFSEPSLDGTNVAFTGIDSSFRRQGIYTNFRGSLNVVADINTPIPNGIGNFTDFNSFRSPVIDKDRIAFEGSGSSGSGIYIKVGNTLKVVADTNTPIPGGTGNFSDFGDVSLDDKDIAFESLGSSEQGIQVQGIYTSIGGTLKVVADRNTPIPRSTGNFTSFANSSLDDGNVVFRGFGSSERGIYIKEVGGTLKVVVDNNTPIPGGTGNFTFFNNPSLDAGNVAFEAFSSNSELGIYTTLGGSLRKVIAPNDSLDGKIIGIVSIGPEALSGNRIAFTAGFTDGSGGIYIATLRK